MLMAERPTPAGRVPSGSSSAARRRCSSACRRSTPACSPSPDAAGARRGRAARCARRPARRCRARSASASPRTSAATSSTASARPRCCTSSCRTAPATCATAPPACRCRATTIELRGDDGRPVADGEVGDLYIRGPERRADVLGQPRASRARRSRATGRRAATSTSRDADGYYVYAGPRDDMLKVSGLTSRRSRSRPRWSSTRRCSRRPSSAAGRRRPDQDQGVRRAEAGPRARCGARRRAEGVRQGQARAVQVPARRSSSSTSCRRPPPARSSASAARARAARGDVTTSIVDVAVGGRDRSDRVRAGRQSGSSTRGSARRATRAPLVVFLHEGLGSVAMWQRLPAAFCDAGGYRGLVFSRYGYGRSTPRPRDERWPRRLHARAGATRCCRALLRARSASTRRGPGCSATATAARSRCIHAATLSRRVAGVVAVAPHIFVEDAVDRAASSRRATPTRRPTCARASRAITPTPIRRSAAGTTSGSRRRFAHWNIEADARRACDAPCWRCRATDDEYGTLAQIDGIRAPRAADRAARARRLRTFAASRPARQR